MHDEDVRALWASIPPRLDVVRLIPQRSRVLDVGAAAGATSLVLRSLGHDVTAVELEEIPYAIARERLGDDTVIRADIEELPIETFAVDAFDIVLFADVLEHLRDPAAVIAKSASWAPTAIASIPNAAHHTVIRQLIRGRWDYADGGILDRTHLRWFGRENMRELFVAAGYRHVSVAGKLGLRLAQRWREPGFFVIARR